mmetsp:Transcript_14929/g.29017  ORF Transcript_14929/g.29017 Transcript_14929/m.29017 type:complete len:113 (+) Transcript_14929:291-629(+)
MRPTFRWTIAVVNAYLALTCMPRDLSIDADESGSETNSSKRPIQEVPRLFEGQPGFLNSMERSLRLAWHRELQYSECVQVADFIVWTLPWLRQATMKLQSLQHHTGCKDARK